MCAYGRVDARPRVIRSHDSANARRSYRGLGYLCSVHASVYRPNPGIVHARMRAEFRRDDPHSGLKSAGFDQMSAGFDQINRYIVQITCCYRKVYRAGLDSRPVPGGPISTAATHARLQPCVMWLRTCEPTKRVLRRGGGQGVGGLDSRDASTLGIARYFSAKRVSSVSACGVSSVVHAGVRAGRLRGPGPEQLSS